MFASKAEASRPSKPSERTPTAQLGDKVELKKDLCAMRFKLSLTIDVLYTVESQGPTHYRRSKKR